MKEKSKKLLSLFILICIILGNMTTVFGVDMKNYDYVEDYQGEYAAVVRNGKWGFINRAGKEVVPCIYDGIAEDGFIDGYAAVVRNGKWGFVNEKGKEIVPCIYDSVGEFGFYNGFAQVEKEGKWGAVNELGKLVVPCIYDEVSEFESGIAAVFKDDKIGIVNELGEEIVPCIYDDVGEEEIDEGIVIFYKDGVGTSFNLVELLNPEKKQAENNLIATPTNANVLVNKVSTKFEAYTIDGNNYFKLRDLAKVLNASKKQFEVQWDNTVKAINLLSSKAYTVVGGEMIQGDGKSKTAKSNTSKIYIDGKEVKLTAYTIGENNYFKLRDIAQAFNIGVTWDGNTKTIGIDTNIDYSQE